MPGQGRRKLTEGFLHGQAPTQAPCVAAHDGKVWHIAGNPPRSVRVNCLALSP